MAIKAKLKTFQRLKLYYLSKADERTGGHYVEGRPQDKAAVNGGIRTTAGPGPAIQKAGKRI
jgi:hypothetical protein